MDVAHAQYVLCYDAPRTLKTYIHRVGRTARAGHVGTAITLLEHKQVRPGSVPCKEGGCTR